MLNACATKLHERHVIVNGEQLDDEALCVLEREGGSIPDGEYWYDPTSGLWGELGGPAFGCIDSGIGVGGQLGADASSGDTGVFLNGRELPPAELELIERLVGPFASGRYFLDGDGYVGFEDGTRLLNLLELISRAESLLCHQAMHLRAGERAFDDDMAGTCDDALAEIDTVRVTRRAR